MTASAVIIYSVIAPLITAVGLLAFILFWGGYRYQLLRSVRVAVDTGGRTYPRALYNLIIALYFMAFSILGLFVLEVDSKGRHVCTAQALAIGLVAIGIGVFHCHLLHDLNPYVVQTRLVLHRHWDLECHHEPATIEVPKVDSRRSLWVAHDERQLREIFLRDCHPLPLSDRHATMCRRGNIKVEEPARDLSLTPSSRPIGP